MSEKKNQLNFLQFDKKEKYYQLFQTIHLGLYLVTRISDPFRATL